MSNRNFLNLLIMYEKELVTLFGKKDQTTCQEVARKDFKEGNANLFYKQ